MRHPFKENIVPAVMVVVKAPTPGKSKTRLIPRLGASGSAALAAAMFQDTVSLIRETGAAIVVSYAPQDGRARLEDLPASADYWLAQIEGSLTERLDHLFLNAAAAGYGPLIAIGADSPGLPIDYVREALLVMERDEADVVLGPTEDGGYYLAGTREPIPALFDRVPWSTDHAFEATQENALRLGLRVHVLPRCYDIDEPEDLDRLTAQLESDPIMLGRCPATAAVLWP